MEAVMKNSEEILNKIKEIPDLDREITKQVVRQDIEEAKKYESYKEEVAEELMSLYEGILNKEEETCSKIKMQDELNILNTRKNKLLDLALDGFLSKEELKTKKILIEKQITNVKVKLKELEESDKRVKNREQEYQKLKDNILQELDISKENIKEYIDGLIDKVIVLKDPFDVKLKIVLKGEV